MIDIMFVAHLIRVTLTGAPFPHLTRALPLLLGTGAQESGFRSVRQLGGGPARGYWQIEPATERSVWADYLAYQPELRAVVTKRCGRQGPNVFALEHDMVYGILLARLLYYWRDPAPLPPATDLQEQAVRYKRYYNTPAGAATEAEYVESYAVLVRPYWPPLKGARHG